MHDATTYKTYDCAKRANIFFTLNVDTYVCVGSSAGNKPGCVLGAVSGRVRCASLHVMLTGSAPRSPLTSAVASHLVAFMRFRMAQSPQRDEPTKSFLELS